MNTVPCLVARHALDKIPRAAPWGCLPDPAAECGGGGHQIADGARVLEPLIP